MNVRFLTPLLVEKIDGDRWVLTEPFKAQIDEISPNSFWAFESLWSDELRGFVVNVPKGFSNDFASVPRIPIAFWLAGDTAHRSGVVHDYLYSVKAPRDLADEVFMACMKAEGVPGWRRSLMWAAVRAFGGGYYQDREPHQDVPVTPA